MSTWGLYRVDCALCGHGNTCSLLKGTNTFGGVSDLDTRLGGMARQDLLKQIQRCDQCGYCAIDLAHAPGIASRVVREARYEQALGDRLLPELARRWHCHSLITEADGKPDEAGWAALSAAWACDDAGPSEGADRMRRRAVEQFKAAIEAGLEVCDEPGGESAVLADVLRRCGQFDEAIEVCAAGSRPGLPEIVATGLIFQRQLCERQDRRRYSFAELERYARSPESWRPIRWWELWRG